MNTWDENVGLRADDVIKLLEGQFKIKIEDIYFIANGWDNDVYKINNKYLFRFPRRDFANKRIEKEGNALPIIKQYVSIPLPTPVFFGNPTNYYPYRFLGYNYLNDLSIEDIVSINAVDSISVLATFLMGTECNCDRKAASTDIESMLFIATISSMLKSLK